MKRTFSIFISGLVFLVGMGLMFYPTVSNWLHEQTASYAVSDYVEQVAQKTNLEYEAEFAIARSYNASLTGDVRSFSDVDPNHENLDYWNTFDQVDGIMGLIEIPAIDVSLPIYHGTAEEVLQKGVGHLEGSALPTGDVGNHTVITGHTGLPTAHLFTDLDELVMGDVFSLEILDQVFTYEVVNIYVVLPSETEALSAQPDKDLVTLVTCTPYGVNSHRLLVQGARIETPVLDTTVTTQTQETLENAPSDTALANLPTLQVVAVILGGLFLLSVFIFAIRSRYTPRHLSTTPSLEKPKKAPPKRLKQKKQ